MTRDAELSFITSRIRPTDAGFKSGKGQLDHWFARHAYANDQRGLGATYVLRRDAEDASAVQLPEILGFYTLSMATIEVAQAAKVLDNLPRYPTPAALIGRLAVDRRAQGRGYGEALLMDALARILTLAGDIGCAGVVVDAKDEDAERFYAKYGFVSVGAVAWPQPRRMFMTMGSLELAGGG